MKVRLVFACAAAGIAFTAFAATPASAAGPLVDEVAVVAAQPPPPGTPSPEQPPTVPPSAEQPPPGEPSPQPPPAQPAPPQVSPTPKGSADTGSLDPAHSQGPDGAAVALGGVALLAAGGLGIAALRRRRHTSESAL